MIPAYLRHISREIKVKDCRTSYAVICEYGEEKFWLYSNYFTPEEKKALEPHDEAMKELTSGFWGYCLFKFGASQLIARLFIF